MTEYNLTLDLSDKDKIETVKIKANDVIELMSKLSIVLMSIQRERHEQAILKERMKLIDDDIPF